MFEGGRIDATCTGSLRPDVGARNVKGDVERTL